MSSTTLPWQLMLGAPATYPATGVTATQSSPWFELTGGPQDVTVTYTSVGTTSGGTIILEETDDKGLGAATASQLESVAASSFTGGAKSCHHFRVGAGMFLRARISSTITGGGSIFVSIVGS
jgi:hypothetical protein